MPVRPRRGRAGFTLIEVMISVLLSVVATIGIIALYQVETRASVFSRRSSEATVLAQDQLERLRTDVLPVSSATPELNLDSRGYLGQGPFTRSWLVTPFTIKGYALLAVTVSWASDDGGPAKSVIVRGRRSL